MTTTTNSTTNYWNAIAVAATTEQYFEPACDVVIQIQPDKTRPKHIPGFKLTDAERAKKHNLHKYGLCCSCDNGLDDRADFICDFGGLMCNACCDYYTQADGY